MVSNNSWCLECKGEGEVVNWLPSIIPQELVSACRRLGKRGLQYIGGNALAFANQDDITAAEQHLKDTVATPLLMAVSSVLAQGPKLFVIPPDLIDDLNQIEIPLKVSDYAQAFPSIIVKSNDEYHLCVYQENRLLLVTVNDHVVDMCGLSNPDRTVESYLSDTALVIDTSEEGLALRYANAIPADKMFTAHRFRGTLNFSLLVVAGGFKRDKQTGRQYKERRKQNGPIKHIVPEIYKPQNIDLWQTRLSNANHPKRDGTGSKKTPHWRRAHWRRVPVGKGRSLRELRLIPAVLVNKDHLSVDIADTSYVVQSQKVEW